MEVERRNKGSTLFNIIIYTSHQKVKSCGNGTSDRQSTEARSRTCDPDLQGNDIIRILHECQVWIDKSVPRDTFWHHEARRVMPNCDTKDRFIFLHALMRRSLIFILFKMIQSRRPPF